MEVGASAGLNLLWDRFHYRYGEQAGWGDPASPVRLACEPRGEPLPPIPGALPNVIRRVGIDLDPVDMGDADAVAWLRALIWPEHRHRVAALDGALRVAASDPPALIAADALDALPGVLENAPPAAALCVFHTFTLNQFPPDARRRFGEILDACGDRRDLYVVSVERQDELQAGVGALLELTAYEERTQDHPRAGPVRQPRHVAGVVRVAAALLHRRALGRIQDLVLLLQRRHADGRRPHALLARLGAHPQPLLEARVGPQVDELVQPANLRGPAAGQRENSSRAAIAPSHAAKTWSTPPTS